MTDPTALVDVRTDAITAVLSEWRQALGAFGVLALLPEAERAGVPLVQSACRDQGVPMLGAVFPALVTDAGFVTSGAWLIALAPMPPWFLLEAPGALAPTVLGRLAAAPPAAPGPSGDGAAPTLFLIFDGMIPNVGSILDRVFRDLHQRVRYAGVNAGSETFQPMPCLFDTETLIGDGVAGLLLADAPPVVVHDYPVARTRMQAISTTGNRISRIDRRPAFEVYQEVTKSDFGVTLTRDNFYDYAVHYPFGLIMAAEVVVRIPVGFDDDGSILCAGEVPPNSVLRLIEAPLLADSRCVQTVAGRLQARPHPVRETLVTFYCAGRRMHFGAAAAEELQQLRAAAGCLRIAGALSLGEIDTLRGFGTPLFHNAALVCL